MKNIILSKCAALGEVIDYFYRVEFQKRGSPHIHMMVWIKNAPKVGESSDEEVTQFIDKYITCKLPNKVEDKDVVLTWNHFDEALRKVGWTYNDYEQALQNILPVDTIALKRAPADRWVNNYNEKCILNWNANMDIQYVMNAYACGKYMLSYICKAEKEMSDILRNVHEEAKEKNLSIQEEMKVLSGVYFHHREVCVQEAIYRICSLKLKQASRKVEFVPTDPDCFRLSKPLSLITKMINEGQEDNEALLYSNFMDKYLDRPEDPLFDICLADFVAKYNFINKKNARTKTKTWLLKTLNFAFYERKQDTVIRYPHFNIDDDEERFYHNLMRLFLPIRKENDIQEPYSDFFHNGNIKFLSGKIQSVKEIVLSNQNRYETKINHQLQEAMRDVAENNIREDVWGALCAETELEREEIADSVKRKYNKLSDLDKDDNPDIRFLLESKNRKSIQSKNAYEIHPTKCDSEKIQPMLKNMTDEQLNIFYYVRDWCLRKNNNNDIDSLRLFVTGGAGTGKSHLLKCMFYEANKILKRLDNNGGDEIRTLVCAPTNAAALNMNCSTIHSTFKIGLRNSNLSENILNTMRSKLNGLCLLFIDEISLVDQSLWRELHTRLGQLTYQTGANIYFGNVSIIAVGDFYQLPPVKGIPLYLPINVIDYWQDLFEYAELTVCQRTKEADYYALANRIRKKPKNEVFSEKDRQILERCVDRYNAKLFREDCLHLFAWNQFVDEHNEKMLLSKCTGIVEVPANKINNGQKLSIGKRKKKFNTYNCKSFKIAIGARVIIEENANRDDAIVKGAFGNIVEIVFNSIKKDFIDHIRIKFDNSECGREHQRDCEICRKEKTVCIQRYNNPRDEDEQKRSTEQFPIRLGWASTVHKVQGLTVNGVVIDLKRFSQPGQGYVSFTRPTNSDELFLKHLKEEAFFCDERIEKSVDKMRKMTYQYFSIDEKTLFRLGFHNVEGLDAHSDDIKTHHWFKNCNIICINETWLKSINCESQLENFTLVVQNRSNSYCNPMLSTRDRGGVGIFIRNDTSFEVINLSYCNIESLTIKIQILYKTCFVTTVYKPPHMNATTFINNFHKQLLLMNLENNQHIIMGDLNEDKNSINTPIHNYFQQHGYRKIVSAYTTIGNTTLDCIFLKSVVLKEKLSIIPAYYSYHSALMLDLFEYDSNLQDSILIHNNIQNTSVTDLSCHSVTKHCSTRKEAIDRNDQIKRKRKQDTFVSKTINKEQETSSGKTQSEKLRKRNSYESCVETYFFKNTRLSNNKKYNSWYSFKDIEDLLARTFEIKENTLVSNNRYVMIFTPILGTNIRDTDIGQHNELFDQIREFKRQRFLDVMYATINEIIIPINLNGTHWVLLIIVYPLVTDSDYYVFYFDSLGNQIPESIVSTLNRSNIIQDKNQIHSNFNQVLQTDERNCGPWIITCASKWLDTKEINILYLSTIDISQERKDQESHLYDLYLARAIQTQ